MPVSPPTRPAVRLADVCSGHGCYPPRSNIMASTDVYVNSFGWHRIGDPWAVHACGDNAHSATLATGSMTVYVNSRGVARVGDLVACGSVCAMGSPNVGAGD